MAVVRLGSVVADIRGSVGDETYIRGQGGIAIRQRVTPTYQNTAHQQAVRATITALSQAWSATLTDTQRKSWRDYAHRNPMPDKWGQLRLTNGYTYFVRVNANFYRKYTVINWPTAPTTNPLWQPRFTFTVVGATDLITIALPPTNYTPPFNDLHLWLFQGRAVSAGVNYYNEGWRYLDNNKFDGAWEDDPWTQTSAFPIDAGQKLFLELSAQDDNTGAISRRYRTTAIAT